MIVVSYKFKKECYFLRSCLVDAGKRFLFMAEWVFLPMGELCSLYNADIQGMVGEREEAKRRTKCFMFKFFLSCYKIWILFYGKKGCRTLMFRGKGGREGCLVDKESAFNAGDAWDMSSIHGWGKSPGGGHGNPAQYSCLENSMDRGAWQVTVHSWKESDTTEATEHAHREREAEKTVTEAEQKEERIYC